VKRTESHKEARIARVVASLADASSPTTGLPDPAVLWRKARLLESLDARRSAARPVQVAHSLSLALAAGALAALAGSKGVSFLQWLEGSATGLVLPLILSLFLLGGGLFLAAGAAAGRNLAHRSERERLQL
jgi:hypothetical protein